MNVRNVVVALAVVSAALSPAVTVAQVPPDAVIDMAPRSHLRPGVNNKETSPLDRFSKPVRTWISTEVARQAAAPTSIMDIQIAIEAQMGRELRKRAQREQIPIEDLANLVIYEILTQAQDDAARKTRELQSHEAPGPEIAANEMTWVRLDALIDETRGSMSSMARIIADAR